MSIFKKKKQEEQLANTEQVTISRETTVKVTFPASKLISILNNAGYNIPIGAILYIGMPPMGAGGEITAIFQWKRKQ